MQLMMNNMSVYVYFTADYPWLDFFTSKPLLAITCAHVCANWGNYTLLIHLPNYMSSDYKD